MLQVSGQRLIRALHKAGFILLRQSGSHAVLRHKDDLTRRAVIPVHGSKTIKPGTLRTILKGIQISSEDLKKLI